MTLRKLQVNKNTMARFFKFIRQAVVLAPAIAIIFALSAPVAVLAAPTPCGSGAVQYTPSIDLGCRNEGNPITDVTFAIIRLLSDGVGLVVVASIVYAGIQYSSSRGDPQATAKAIGRIRSAVTALLIYIFGYALLNYIIPIGFLHQ